MFGLGYEQLHIAYYLFFSRKPIELHSWPTQSRGRCVMKFCTNRVEFFYLFIWIKRKHRTWFTETASSIMIQCIVYSNQIITIWLGCHAYKNNRFHSYSFTPLNFQLLVIFSKLLPCMSNIHMHKSLGRKFLFSCSTCK